MKNLPFLFLFLIVSASSYAQQMRLYGRVTDKHYKGIPNVQVSLMPLAKVVMTDADGKYEFAGLSENHYLIHFEVHGYENDKKRVRVSKETQELNVVLHTRFHQLEEAVVEDHLGSYRKKGQSMNLEIVHKDFIQRNLGGSLMTTLSRLPGVKTIGIGSGQSKPLIRGMGFNRVVVVDKGVKHEGQQWGADHGLEMDQFAAGEIEILKGAASFIYGSDAIGGIIDVKPVPVPLAYTIGGSVNLIGKTNNNLYGASTNVYGRNQHWFFNSRFTFQDYGDYRVPTDKVYVYDFAVPLYHKQVRNTAGKERAFHFNTGYVTDHFQSIFYLSNVFNTSGFFANAHGLEPRNVNLEVHDASSRDILMPKQEVNHFKIINRSTLYAGAHQWQAELGYQHNFRQEFSQYTNHGYMPAVYPDEMRQKIPVDLERAYNKKVFSANLNDQISIGNHTLNVGFNSEHQDNEINGWTFLVPAFKQTTAGVFAYDKYRWNEKLLLHAAIRYDYAHTRMSEYRDWFETPVTENGVTHDEYVVRAKPLNRHFNSFVWSLGLNYDPSQFSFKANIGKSFRVPITKEFGANGINYHYYSYERGNPNLSPEESYQLDVSFGWDDDRWSAQVSPFYNYFPNYIYLNPTPYHLPGPAAGNQLFEYAQSRVMRYGGEVKVKYHFLRSLSAEVLGEYLYAQQLSGAKKGFTLPFSPPATALFNLTWSPVLKGRMTNPYLSVDYRVTAAQHHIVPPEKMTAGYQLVHLQAGAQLNIYQQPLNIRLQIQNLLNTKYMNHTSFYRLIELPEMGRNAVLSLTVPFGMKKQNSIQN